jgi:hypothetical protein
MTTRLIWLSCLIASNVVWAAGLSPTDPRVMQPGPGVQAPMLEQEIAVWVFADIKLTVLGPTTVKIDWQSRQGAGSYRVIRNDVAIANVPQRAPPLNFVDDGLTPGATATYRVLAIGTPAPSGPTASGMKGSKTIRGDTGATLSAAEVVLEESRTTSATPPPLLPAVDLAAKTTSFTSVRLTWTQPRWATPTHNLYRDRQFVRQVSGATADDAGVARGTHVYAVQSIFAKADGTPLPGPVSQEVSINVGPKVCMPGDRRMCDYMGSAGTSHCPVGEQICNATGDGYGACQDTKFQCSNWDTISFKECAYTGRAEYVGVLRDIPSGDNPEQYVLKRKATVNGVVMNARAYSRDVWGNHWGSFEVGTSQCFVYKFNVWQTCSSPLSGSKLYQDPNFPHRTLREGFTGVCLGECVGSGERKVYPAEPVWGSEPFTPGSLLGGGTQRPDGWNQEKGGSMPFPTGTTWGQSGDIKRCETGASKEFPW